MHQIKPLAALSHSEIVDLARAAADADTPQAEANPFEPGTTAHCTFSLQYVSRQRELEPAEG